MLDCDSAASRCSSKQLQILSCSEARLNLVLLSQPSDPEVRGGIERNYKVWREYYRRSDFLGQNEVDSFTCSRVVNLSAGELAVVASLLCLSYYVDVPVGFFDSHVKNYTSRENSFLV